MSEPLVSIVIPVFNGADFLRETLDAALNQTHPAVEIIAVDDGSTDRSPAILRDYGSRLTVMAQANGGGSRARNAGWARSSGELLAFLDQDDVLAPGKIARQVELLRRFPAEDFVVCDGREFEGGRILNEHLVHPEIVARFAGGGPEGFCLQPYRTLLRQNPLRTLGQTLIRREAVARIGAFCEDRRVAADHEWFLRHAAAGGVMRFHPDRLLDYRYHPGSNSGARERRLLRYSAMMLNSLIVQRAAPYPDNRARLEAAIRGLGWKVALLCLVHGAAEPAADRALAEETLRVLRQRLPAHGGIRLASAWLAGGKWSRASGRLLRHGLNLKRKLQGVRPLSH